MYFSDLGIVFTLVDYSFKVILRNIYDPNQPLQCHTQRYSDFYYYMHLDFPQNAILGSTNIWNIVKSV